MNPPEFPAGGGASPSPASSKKELQLQGPRPPPLKVSKESHKIKKPPLPPPAAAAHQHHAPPPEAAQATQQQQRQPVIIYSVSPKVIHVNSSDFMDVVQRLTGSSSGDEPPAVAGGDVSPAARLASIEKTSPSSEKERVARSVGYDEMTWMMEGVEVGQFQGILSPAPATLPPIPADFFSPVSDPQTVSFFNDFWSVNSFLASPSGLFSGSVVSPQPSPDLFNIFDC